MSQLIVKTPSELNKFLETAKGSIAAALPRHLTAERMMRLALTAFSTNPGLRECSAQSILASVVLASQLGLEIGVAGQGYLVPYKGTCTFVPGWQGLVGLMNRTGLATVWTGAVFEGDTWEFELGSSPRCRHVPGPNSGDEACMTHAYAVGKVNGSETPVIEAWTAQRVRNHRDKFNKVGQRHYSFNNFEMYARKVVLLQVLKYMPKSIEINNAVAAADAAIVGGVARAEGGCVIIEQEETDIPAGRVGQPATAEKLLNVKKKEPVTAAEVHVDTNLSKLRELLKGANITEAQLVTELHTQGMIDPDVTFATLPDPIVGQLLIPDQFTIIRNLVAANK